MNKVEKEEQEPKLNQSLHPADSKTEAKGVADEERNKRGDEEARLVQ